MQPSYRLAAPPSWLIKLTLVLGLAAYRAAVGRPGPMPHFLPSVAVWPEQTFAHCLGRGCRGPWIGLRPSPAAALRLVFGLVVRPKFFKFLVRRIAFLRRAGVFGTSTLAGLIV